MFWSSAGVPIKGVGPRNQAPLVEGAAPGGATEFCVEAASNPGIASGWSFRPTLLGDLATAGSEPQYRFVAAWLSSVDAELIVVLPAHSSPPPALSMRSRARPAAASLSKP